MNEAGPLPPPCGTPEDIHPAAVKGFSQEELYDRKCPEYTNSTVDFINGLLLSVKGEENRENPDGYDVVEVGSGTGKFTLSFLRRIQKPIRYLATEPLGNMLGVIRESRPDVFTLQCAAHALPLPDASAKMVIAAQCFHWFADLSSITEIHRVLVPGGKLVLIWNQRDLSVPWIGQVEDILEDIYIKCNATRQQNPAWKRIFDTYTGFEELNYVSLPRPPIKGRVEDILAYFSTISVLSLSEENMAAVSEFIKTHPDLQGQAEITVPFTTDIYWCSKKI
ncbi:uncharacterized protein LOC135462707 [Liolophura sinensis]|uniref:uncharacterized protein LOC135462707 n=1 Tax=Liolophura sinensis TaxID=3198878 RepID=UPI003158138B